MWRNGRFLKTFLNLLVQTKFRKQNLDFIQTLGDLDMVRLIGSRQALGKPLTLKLLVLEGLGSFATVQRRLMRLKRLEIVVSTRSVGDKRTQLLTISPSAIRIYKRFGREMQKCWCEGKTRRKARRVTHLTMRKLRARTAASRST